MSVDIQNSWNADEFARVTQGRWRIAPSSVGWRCDGICAEPGLFRNTQMLLAPAGPVGLRPRAFERLAPKAAGIIAQAGEVQAHWGGPLLEVKDLGEAVTALALDSRSRFRGQVIAVTGSVGKTSTVAMAAHAMSGVGPSDRSQTTANSPYGIGWNLASMNLHASFWVQEAAVARMEKCSAMIQPHVAIVTAIAPAHVARFRSTAEIAKQKALIYTGMAPGGIAVINADMPEFPIFESSARAAKLRVVRFGSTRDCDVRLICIEGSTVSVDIFGEVHTFEFGAAGRHMAMNATAVLASTAAMGLPVSLVAGQLASFRPLPGRGRRVRTGHANGSIEVWDEAYNANPASMRAALQVLVDTPLSEVPCASRVLVLGDMLELGKEAQSMHLDLEGDLRAARPDRVLLCGKLMQALSERLHGEIKGQWFEDVDALLRALDTWIKDGDVVLVKSSNGVGLTQVVSRLLRSTPGAAA
ncbi:MULTISPECIES: Mur ligase family protein [unclassified Paraburkholderia]|uniref:UDP-N-acetylmuramoyl-tripeptide--D-alanyl-D- alanine ligase n=1 Tax=unclassified Paraburkholderia TaxID=2615204 RepID=UPI00161CA3A2|nr:MULTISPECIES: Mur ligase family protein [unclassified Paraburkholderia]MBB5445336.1 UDP-N-acetylmuramoyl-tripeptide--D-alanyl-D-alanine ligase [Paraburkholderia sp. WSM4177]MBB5485884.1 UDP-N-acetylmuramoyl-tripeptide--D-alanyl-D-alanine ligase [Paraburkholderia sp. WSM4180]